MLVTWRTSSRCVGNNHCVEVARLPGLVIVRDSAGAVVAVTPAAWMRFVRGLSGR